MAKRQPVPPLTGTDKPNFCKIFETLVSIWMREHGMEGEVTFRELQPGEEPTPGAVVLKPVHCPPPVWEPSTRKHH